MERSKANENLLLWKTMNDASLFQLHRNLCFAADDLLYQDDWHLDDLHDDLPPGRGLPPHLQGDSQHEAEENWRCLKKPVTVSGDHKNQSSAKQLSWTDPQTKCPKVDNWTCIFLYAIVFRDSLIRQLHFCGTVFDMILPFLAAGDLYVLTGTLTLSNY